MLFLAALLLASDTDPVPESFHFRSAEALVVDKNRSPLFRAERGFLLQISGNPDGHVIAYDPAKRMIRVSEHNPWWIPCSELQAEAVACAEQPRRSTRAPVKTQPDQLDAVMTLAARGVPSCPGDPRCPTGN